MIPNGGDDNVEPHINILRICSGSENYSHTRQIPKVDGFVQKNCIVEKKNTMTDYQATEGTKNRVSYHYSPSPIARTAEGTLLIPVFNLITGLKHTSNHKRKLQYSRMRPIWR